MTNDEIYDFIGELAIALYSKKVQISLGALRAIMLDKGKDYVNNRGMASAVSAAYRRWKTKDPIIYYAIAYTYTDKEGNLAWDEVKSDKKKKPGEETGTVVEAPVGPEEPVEEEPVPEEVQNEAQPVSEELQKEESPEEPSQGELDLQVNDEAPETAGEEAEKEPEEEKKPEPKKKAAAKKPATKKKTAAKKK